MHIIHFIKDFWLDFFSAYYRRLIKNAKYETPLSIVLHVSFVQSINLNTIVILFLNLFFKQIRLNFLILFLPIVILSLLNSYYFYYKLNSVQREGIISRKPKYKTILYSFYSLMSTVLLALAGYIYSEY